MYDRLLRPVEDDQIHQQRPEMPRKHRDPTDHDFWKPAPVLAATLRDENGDSKAGNPTNIVGRAWEYAYLGP